MARCMEPKREGCSAVSCFENNQKKDRSDFVLIKIISQYILLGTAFYEDDYGK